MYTTLRTDDYKGFHDYRRVNDYRGVQSPAGNHVAQNPFAAEASVWQELP